MLPHDDEQGIADASHRAATARSHSATHVLHAMLRRIEALTGADALWHYDHQGAVLHEPAALLNVHPGQAPDRLRQRLQNLAEAQRHLETLHQAEVRKHGQNL